MHEPKLINKGMKYVRINVAVTIVDLVGVEEGWHDRLCLLEMEPTVCAVWVNTRSKRSEGHEIQICLAEEELHVHTSRILWMWKVCLSSGRPNSPAGIASLRSGGVTSMPSTVVDASSSSILGTLPCPRRLRSYSDACYYPASHDRSIDHH